MAGWQYLVSANLGHDGFEDNHEMLQKIAFSYNWDVLAARSVVRTSFDRPMCPMCLRLAVLRLTLNHGVPQALHAPGRSQPRACKRKHPQG